MKSAKNLIFTIVLTGMLLVSCNIEDTIIDAIKKADYSAAVILSKLDTNNTNRIGLFYPLHVTEGDSIAITSMIYTRLALEVYFYKGGKTYPAQYKYFWPAIEGVVIVPKLPADGEYEIVYKSDSDSIYYKGPNKVYYSSLKADNPTYYCNMDGLICEANFKSSTGDIHAGGSQTDTTYNLNMDFKFKFSPGNSFVMKSKDTVFVGTLRRTDGNVNPNDSIIRRVISFVIDKPNNIISYLQITDNDTTRHGNQSTYSTELKEANSFVFRDLPYSIDINGNFMVNLTEGQILQKLISYSYSSNYYSWYGSHSSYSKSSKLLNILGLKPGSSVKMLLPNY